MIKNMFVSKNIFLKNIILYFQPIQDKYNNIILYECLARIKNHEQISPAFFIKDIKNKGLYPEFTKTIINLVTENMKLNNYKYSINLDYQDIVNEDISNYLFFKIDQIENIQNRLTIEILENEIENFEKIVSFIKKVKTRKINIAIDDFGAKYSNFANIIEIDPHILKIDGSIIKNIENERNLIITKNITKMAKDLGIHVVAEFVENKNIYNKIKNLGIEYMQGYYFSKPKKTVEDFNRKIK